MDTFAAHRLPANAHVDVATEGLGRNHGDLPYHRTACGSVVADLTAGAGIHGSAGHGRLPQHGRHDQRPEEVRVASSILEQLVH